MMKDATEAACAGGDDAKGSVAVNDVQVLRVESDATIMDKEEDSSDAFHSKMKDATEAACAGGDDAKGSVAINVVQVLRVESDATIMDKEEDSSESSSVGSSIDSSDEETVGTGGLVGLTLDGLGHTTRFLSNATVGSRSASSLSTDVAIDTMLAPWDENPKRNSAANLFSSISAHSRNSSNSSNSQEDDMTICSLPFEYEEEEPESIEPTSLFVDLHMVNVLNQGIRAFNLNPELGMKFIVAQDVVHSVEGDDEGNARRMAIFLWHTSGLNKVQLGVVLSSEKHMLVLENYIALFDFSAYGPTIRGLEFSMRMVFKSFKPVGEAQKIERILSMFTEKFNADNNTVGVRLPDAHFHGETTLLLCFGIVILNTDLHTPSNLNKMTQSEFVARWRGLDQGEDLDRKELVALYQRVQHSEIKYKVDRSELNGNLFTQPDKSGWLHKRGHSIFGLWKPRWFILSANTLYYFRNSEDIEYLGFIPLENVLVRTCFDVDYNWDNATAGEINSRVTLENANAAARGSSLPISSSSRRSLPRRQRLHRTQRTLKLKRNSTLGNETFRNTRKSSSSSSSSSSSLRDHLPLTRSEGYNGSNDSNGNSSDLGVQATGSFSTTNSSELKNRSKRKRDFWFEIYPCNEREVVKSLRITKNGCRPGKHRSIRLRADSRQELELWVEIINRYKKMNLVDLARGRRQQQQQTLQNEQRQVEPIGETMTSPLSVANTTSPRKAKRKLSSRFAFQLFRSSVDEGSNSSIDSPTTASSPGSDTASFPGSDTASTVSRDVSNDGIIAAAAATTTTTDTVSTTSNCSVHSI